MNELMIKSAASKYYKFSLLMIAGVTIAILIYSSIMSLISILANALLVSILFSLFSSFAYGRSWKSMARMSQSGLTKFYLAAPALRLIAAAAVVLVYSLIVHERQPIIHFVSVFCAYYVVLLIFDCVYFAKVELRKKNK
ncbi:MAG: hypothetical protein Q4D41_07785 [Prevotellaceae bacterium]|nr:hypothetical protein [Prevotellaceae bacterium]